MSDLASDYDRRAQANRPTDPEAIAREVLRLTRDGLKIRDVAAALRLNQAEVAKILVRASLDRQSADRAVPK